MSQIVRKVDLENLGVPHQTLGGMLEIRFTNDNGDTEVWMVPNSMWGESAETLTAVIRRGGVKLAFLDSGVDSRIGQLLERAEVVREHLDTHHDELTTLYRREFGTGYSCQNGSSGGTAKTPA